MFLLPPEVLAERLLGHFNFIVHAMPSSIQLFKGPPGIHVSVYNPSESEALAIGGGAGLPLETTVVRTHTLDSPFIFESLKELLQQIRACASFRPCTRYSRVRRQWERIVWIGEPQPGRHEGIVLPFPDRAGRFEGAPAQDAARNIFHPEMRLPGR